MHVVTCDFYLGWRDNYYMWSIDLNIEYLEKSLVKNDENIYIWYVSTWGDMDVLMDGTRLSFATKHKNCSHFQSRLENTYASPWMPQASLAKQVLVVNSF